MNGSLVGTHEFNASIFHPAMHAFWETNRNRLSRRRRSFGHPVTVRIRVGRRTVISTGRVSARRRLRNGAWRVTELRFRPMTAADARFVYAGVSWPVTTIAVIRKSAQAGIDYEYEVIPPGHPRWRTLRLGRGVRERYD